MSRGKNVIMKLEVGQKVWVKLKSFHHHGEDKRGLMPCEIVSIGRKYFKIKSLGQNTHRFDSQRFDIETLKENIDSSYKDVVYLDPKIYFDEIERQDNLEKIRKVLNNHFALQDMSNLKLKRIARLLESKEL